MGRQDKSVPGVGDSGRVALGIGLVGRASLGGWVVVAAKGGRQAARKKGGACGRTSIEYYRAFVER